MDLHRTSAGRAVYLQRICIGYALDVHWICIVLHGMSIGFASTDLITALLLVQFVGFPAALIFGRLGEKWGVKRSIFLAIGIYMLATIGGMQMTQKYEFYLLAAVIGLVQGGIQALSRSYYSRLITHYSVLITHYSLPTSH